MLIGCYVFYKCVQAFLGEDTLFMSEIFIEPNLFI